MSNIPYEVPDNFDEDLFRKESRELMEGFEENKQALIGDREPPFAIGPRQNIIDFIEPFSVDGKRNRNFRGDEHQVFLDCDYPPCEARLIYKNLTKNVMIMVDVFLLDPYLSDIKNYSKALFQQAKKANRKARSEGRDSEQGIRAN